MTTCHTIPLSPFRISLIYFFLSVKQMRISIYVAPGVMERYRSDISMLSSINIVHAPEYDVCSTYELVIFAEWKPNREICFIANGYESGELETPREISFSIFNFPRYLSRSLHTVKIFIQFLVIT